MVGDRLTWTSAQTLTYGPTTTQFATGTTNNATLSIPVTLNVDTLIKNPSASFGWRITDSGSQAAGDDLHVRNLRERNDEPSTAAGDQL